MPKKRKLSVSIVALGPSMKRHFVDQERAANDGKSRLTDELWTLNRGAFWLKGVHLIFSMDSFKVREETFGKTAIERFSHLDTKIFTSEYDADYPRSEPYPLAEVEKALPWGGIEPCKVLNNSLNFALAYALYRKVTHLRLYGCEFATRPSTLVEDEAHQPWWHAWYMKENLPECVEPGVEGAAFLLGVAAAQGVEVHIPPTSTLLDHDLPSFYYGYRDDDDIPL
mgnify:FL=1